MTPSFRYVSFSFFAFLALQQAAFGLICYSCGFCNTVNSNIATSNVPDNAGYSCRKSITLAGSKVITTIRDAVTSCSEVDAVILGSGFRTTCCRTDRCNSGIATSSSIGLSLALVSLVVLFKMF
ncbi:unnamed protein product [Rotaria sordida]|uniref:Uncharacterized protein n=1 Tax=Rotaria sordida TaxID=392033 RepID=A0A815H7L1_9BILA|nr:unnamed protein product [Rotaria sordida]CAF1350641.1 unnamed protein product [Rotaria sordida]